MLTRVQWLPIVGLNVAVALAWMLLVGVTAPRWPRAWLTRDAGPLHLAGFETVARYRQMGVPRLAELLPEAGGLFGGESKAQLPGRTPDDLANYLVEVRRAEWVHWLALVALLLIWPWNPWWLWLMFVVIDIVAQGVFIVVLRYNRLRLTAVLQRGAR